MVNPLTLPAGANPETDQIVGFDELGAPLRVTSRGVRYLVSYPAQQPAPRVPSVLETVVDPFTGRATHEQQPLMPTSSGAALQGILDAVTQGITAPGRAARGQEPTLGDVWSTALDWGAMSAPMRAPAGAIRSGAMGSQSPADEIASMLREGRASEVTDPMMAALTPQDNMRLFQLYEEGATGQPMPMDEASRMARAREMGFDASVFHETSADFPAFDMYRQGASYSDSEMPTGVFTKPDANTIGLGGETETQMPLVGRLGNNFGAANRDDLRQQMFAIDPEYQRMWQAADEYDSQMAASYDARFEGQAGQAWLNASPEEYFSSADEVLAAWDSGNAERARAARSQINAALQRGGYDSLTLDRDAGSMGRATATTVFTDPRNIRSRFARFDPRLSHLSNLSAATVPAGVGYGLLSGQDEEIRQYLGLLGGM